MRIDKKEELQGCYFGEGESRWWEMSKEESEREKDTHTHTQGKGRESNKEATDEMMGILTRILIMLASVLISRCKLGSPCHGIESREKEDGSTRMLSLTRDSSKSKSQVICLPLYLSIQDESGSGCTFESKDQSKDKKVLLSRRLSQCPVRTRDATQWFSRNEERKEPLTVHSLSHFTWLRWKRKRQRGREKVRKKEREKWRQVKKDSKDRVNCHWCLSSPSYTETQIFTWHFFVAVTHLRSSVSTCLEAQAQAKGKEKWGGGECKQGRTKNQLESVGRKDTLLFASWRREDGEKKGRKGDSWTYITAHHKRRRMKSAPALRSVDLSHTVSIHPQRQHSPRVPLPRNASQFKWDHSSTGCLLILSLLSCSFRWCMWVWDEMPYPYSPSCNEDEEEKREIKSKGAREEKQQMGSGGKKRWVTFHLPDLHQINGKWVNNSQAEAINTFDSTWARQE